MSHVLIVIFIIVLQIHIYVLYILTTSIDHHLTMPVHFAPPFSPPMSHMDSCLFLLLCDSAKQNYDLCVYDLELSYGTWLVEQSVHMMFK